MVASLIAIVAMLGAPQAQAASLREAFVRFIYYPSHVRVISEYSITRDGSPLTFESPRLPHQIVVVRQATGDGYDLEAEQALELRRLTAPARESSEPEQFRFIYDVSGDVDSLPVFRPLSLADAEGEIYIDILGLTEGERPADLSFESSGDGAYAARPHELPEVVVVREPAAPSPRLLWFAAAAALASLALMIHLVAARRGAR